MSKICFFPGIVFFFFPGELRLQPADHNVRNSCLPLLSAATTNKILFRSDNKSASFLLLLLFCCLTPRRPAVTCWTQIKVPSAPSEHRRSARLMEINKPSAKRLGGSCRTEEIKRCHSDSRKGGGRGEKNPTIFSCWRTQSPADGDV